MENYQQINVQEIKNIPMELIDGNDEKIKRDVTCPLCYEVLQTPILVCSGCNYFACSDCIIEMQRHSPNKCPQRCQPNVTFVKKPIPYLDDKLQDLKIKCIYSKNQDQPSCQEVLKYSNFKNHILNCEYVIQHCMNDNCEVVLIKKEMDQHQEDCEFQILECDYCFQHLQKKEFNNHDCEYKLVKCSRNQCTCEIQKYLLQKHVEEECDFIEQKCQYCQKVEFKKNLENHENNCDEQIVPCSGCNIQFKQKDLQNHTNQCSEIKISCFQCYFEYKRKDALSHVQMDCIVNLRKLLQESKLQIENKDKEIKQLKDELENQEHTIQILHSDLENANQKYKTNRKRLF